MKNRYNELSDEQKLAFDQMINSVASNQADIADIMTDTAHQALREVEQKLWRITYKEEEQV